MSKSTSDLRDLFLEVSETDEVVEEQEGEDVGPRVADEDDLGLEDAVGDGLDDAIDGQEFDQAAEFE